MRLWFAGIATTCPIAALSPTSAQRVITSEPRARSARILASLTLTGSSAGCVAIRRLPGEDNYSCR